MGLRARFDKLLEQLRSSYWFIPTIMALAAFVLSLASTMIDRWLGGNWIPSQLFFVASRPDGARAILTAVAGSMIGVAGTVFSVTMAAVVYASGQYGPRLLTNFLSDRGNQITLGVFTATFVFSIMVLRTIHSADESSSASDLVSNGFVPNLGLILSMALALCSIAVLIYFIHHVPSRIHISNVIRGIGDALLAQIDSRFPKNVGTGTATREDAEEAWWQLPAALRPGADAAAVAEEFAEVNAETRGYIQFLDDTTLMSTASQHTIVIRLTVRPGDFVFEGSLLCEAWPKERVTPEAERGIRSAFAMGALRTPTDDMLFMVDELVEIAARALSPGVNDPFTAITCIDWLGAALAQLAGRPAPDPLRIDAQGKLCIVAETLGFHSYLRRSLGAIREYAAGDKIATTHFLRTLEIVARHCASDANLDALREEATNLLHLARGALAGPSLAEVEVEAKTVFTALSSPKRRRPFPQIVDLADRLAEMPAARRHAD
ncbi:DUF2254 domain-containing protein [Pararhizobium mangrovi]|uniref:DUF2254 domain-containing protein n=1 Tax=Pararhizobium mangrovi TaxID=2590452 RepID=A0A506UHB4_9HYPH|nr:DUF2254 domain-containing protein [Pararhizobium mangrovi]TPW32694.1 DUF2254 domain-containing protein [Pararhizobium mangrovi]